MKKILILAISASLISGCNDADIATSNLSTAADNFEVNRRVVFYNGITSDYILTIEGLCSLGNNDTNKRMSIICKTGPSEYKRHFLGLSDNVTYFVEQLGGKSVSAYHYRVVFKPAAIIPDLEIK